jgi:hypothetical protein
MTDCETTAVVVATLAWGSMYMYSTGTQCEEIGVLLFSEHRTTEATRFPHGFQPSRPSFQNESNKTQGRIRKHDMEILDNAAQSTETAEYQSSDGLPNSWASSAASRLAVMLDINCTFFTLAATATSVPGASNLLGENKTSQEQKL